MRSFWLIPGECLALGALAAMPWLPRSAAGESGLCFVKPWFPKVGGERLWCAICGGGSSSQRSLFSGA
jgi:hypothetical protein